MKCLDTDILVSALRGDAAARKVVSVLDEEGGAATTVINAYEIIFGARRSSARQENLREAYRILSKLQILEMTLGSADKAGEIHANLVDKGSVIDIRDIFIGSIAFSRNCELITRNTKDFSKIKGLKIKEW